MGVPVNVCNDIGQASEIRQRLANAESQGFPDRLIILLTHIVMAVGIRHHHGIKHSRSF